MAVAQIAAVVVAVAGMVAALVVVITGARGSSRVLGTIGAVLLGLGVLSRFAYQWMIERFLGRVEDATIVGILAAELAIGGLLIGAGLILVTRAIVIAGRPSKI